MAKLSSRLGRFVAIAAVCLLLWGCGIVNPRPPRAAVEAAIAQKLIQTQTVLYRQPAPADFTELAQVGRLRIADHHWITLANKPAVEVVGTYHLKGGQLTAAQRRQTRSFDLYLQRGASKEEWLLLEPLGRLGEVPQWQTMPLSAPNQASSAELD
ncbi:MAG: hypothetical protein WBB18_18915 [Nodosilinea sp.]